MHSDEDKELAVSVHDEADLEAEIAQDLIDLDVSQLEVLEVPSNDSSASIDSTLDDLDSYLKPSSSDPQQEQAEDESDAPPPPSLNRLKSSQDPDAQWEDECTVMDSVYGEGMERMTKNTCRVCVTPNEFPLAKLKIMFMFVPRAKERSQRLQHFLETWSSSSHFQDRTFASRLTRHLRSTAARALEDHGRVTMYDITSAATDEINEYLTATPRSRAQKLAAKSRPDYDPNAIRPVAITEAKDEAGFNIFPQLEIASTKSQYDEDDMPFDPMARADVLLNEITVYTGPISKILSRFPQHIEVDHVEPVMRADLAQRFDSYVEALTRSAHKSASATVAARAVKVQVAFHGTALKNIGSIVRNGLVVGGKNSIGVRVANGTALGHGIYTALDPQIAMGYSQDAQKLLVVAICSGLVGKHCVQSGQVCVLSSASQVLPCFVVHYRDTSVRASAVPRPVQRAPVVADSEIYGISSGARSADPHIRKQAIAANTARALCQLPFGFGPAGTKFQVLEIAPYNDDDETWGDYQDARHQTGGLVDNSINEYQADRHSWRKSAQDDDNPNDDP